MLPSVARVRAAEAAERVFPSVAVVSHTASGLSSCLGPLVQSLPKTRERHEAVERVVGEFLTSANEHVWHDPHEPAPHYNEDNLVRL